MAEQKIVGYDYTMPYADGSDNITIALKQLLNSYPGLNSNDEITFAVLENTSGKAMFPTSSVVILTEKKSITGHVKQTCAYPILLIYRASGLSENKKVKIKEWLDKLGRWLEKQPIEIDGSLHRLGSYPKLTGEQQFEKISATSQGYLYAVTEDKVEDWAISIQAAYINEYDLEDLEEEQNE